MHKTSLTDTQRQFIASNSEDDFETVDDAEITMSAYKVTDYEDCPKVNYKNFVEAKELVMEDSPFEGEKVDTKITGFEVKKAGWLQGEYSVFNLETHVCGD